MTGLEWTVHVAAWPEALRLLSSTSWEAAVDTRSGMFLARGGSTVLAACARGPITSDKTSVLRAMGFQVGCLGQHWVWVPRMNNPVEPGAPQDRDILLARHLHSEEVNVAVAVLSLEVLREVFATRLEDLHVLHRVWPVDSPPQISRG